MQKTADIIILTATHQPVIVLVREWNARGYRLSSTRHGRLRAVKCPPIITNKMEQKP